MDHYDYKEDNKLHTRYSELRNCTKGSVGRVVERRLFDLKETNPYTEFGTLRHEVFANFLRANRKLPKAVREATTYMTRDEAPEILTLEIDEDCIERSYGIEVWENVVIHMTPDIHNTTWVADFKTTTKGVSNYKNDKQVIFYAWLLNKLGHKIDTGYYICELWDKERTNIQGYEVMEKKITKEDLEFIEEWAKERVERLFEALQEVTNEL